MLNLNFRPAGWTFRQRSILLQRLVEFLYRPPFLGNLQRLIGVEFVIVCAQIESTSRSVLVFKDLLRHPDREIDPVEIYLADLALQTGQIPYRSSPCDRVVVITHRGYHVFLGGHDELLQKFINEIHK